MREAAIKATWQGPPVWFHGDVSAANLLVKRGRLGAAIDFGCSGVGDPACDTTVAWTLFSEDMVISIDIPLFNTPWGGLRIEDGYLITAHGAELLHHTPYRIQK